jgi:hypothetical protein
VVTLADAAGLVELLVGSAGDARWDLETAAVQHTPTAKDVRGERRLYAINGDAITGDTLVYATELQYADRPMAPHLNASLTRISPTEPGEDAGA